MIIYLNESGKDSVDVQFNTPEELSKWMKKNIKYAKFTKQKSAEELFKSKRGSCHDQVPFEYLRLKKMGVSPSILFFIAYKEGSDVGGMTHSLVYYKEGDKICWFENAWEQYAGIRKYKDVAALKADLFEKYKSGYPKEYKEFPNLEFKNTSIGKFKPGCNLSTLVDNVFG